MSEDTKPGFEPANQEGTEDQSSESELDTLKHQAKQMGIDFHPSIGVDKLRAKIKDRLQGNAEQNQEEQEKVEAEAEAQPVNAARKGESENQRRARLLREAGRLRRIRITCMNPMKSEWEGEIFTSGNGIVGNFRKYVPFNVEWHVPQIILNMIEDRMYQSFYTVRDQKTGQQGRRGKLVKEFAVEILPDLTEKELKSLGQRQAMARGTAAE